MQAHFLPETCLEDLSPLLMCPEHPRLGHRLLFPRAPVMVVDEDLQGVAMPLLRCEMHLLFPARPTILETTTHGTIGGLTVIETETEILEIGVPLRPGVLRLGNRETSL